MESYQEGEEFGLKDPDCGCLLRDKKGKVGVFKFEEACYEYGRKHPKSPFTEIVDLEEEI